MGPHLGHGIRQRLGAGMLHLGVRQPNGQVVTAFAGRHHEATLQPLERYVPQPRRVAAVGDPGVDRHHCRGAGITHHLQCLLPPGGVFGQQQPHRLAVDGLGAVAAGHVADVSHGRHSGDRIHTEQFCRGRSHGGVGPVCPARQCQRNIDHRAVGGVQAVAVEPQVRLRASKVTRRALPLRHGICGLGICGLGVGGLGVSGKRDAPCTRRTPGGVEGPPGSGTHPHHRGCTVVAGRCSVAGIPGRAGTSGTAGSPHHQWVVGVGHNGTGGEFSQHRAPAVGNAAHLLGAVELVAAQVQQHHHGGAHLGKHLRHPQFVAFQRSVGGGGLGPQCHHHAGVHVGAVGVGGHRTTGGQRPGQEVVGGGLSIGATHQRHVAAGGELGQQTAVHEDRQLTPDHAARTHAGPS